MKLRTLLRNSGTNFYKTSTLEKCNGPTLPFIQKRLKSESASIQQSKDYYRWFIPVQTRWKDNDCYGHMNNAVYHSIYDSIINIFLIRHCGLSIDRTTSSVVGFMVRYEILNGNFQR